MFSSVLENVVRTKILYQIIGPMNDSKLYAIVIELLNQSKEIWSLDVVPAGRSCKARESGVRELEDGVTQQGTTKKNILTCHS